MSIFNTEIFFIGPLIVPDLLWDFNGKVFLNSVNRDSNVDRVKLRISFLLRQLRIGLNDKDGTL